MSQQKGKVDVTTRGEGWYHNKRGKLILEQEGKVDIITRGKVDITTRGESWYHNKRGKLISQQEGKVNITTRGEN
jgi:hypothetical protein